VLRDGEEIIGESSIIIEHVAGAQLVPSLQARKWTGYATSTSPTPSRDSPRRDRGRMDEPAVARTRGTLEMAYGMLEGQLAQREFLAGDGFSIADCAAAPGLFYALAVHPWAQATTRS